MSSRPPQGLPAGSDIAARVQAPVRRRIAEGGRGLTAKDLEEIGREAVLLEIRLKAE
jgi:hypothetical protein